ncbi:MAG: hypothetical protein ACNYZI_09890, partial [Anaerolineales bacterium]
TFINFIQRYEDQLRSAHGKMILVGVNETVKEQLDRTGVIQEDLGERNIYQETAELFESMHKAEAAASRWLGETKDDSAATK